MGKKIDDDDNDDDNLKLHDVTFWFHICFSLFRSVCRFLANACWHSSEWPICLVFLFEMIETMLMETVYWYHEKEAIMDFLVFIASSMS